MLTIAPCAAALLLLMVAISGSLQAMPITHVGLTDPTLEGWTPTGLGLLVSGPVTDSLPAWQILDEAEGDVLFYSADPLSFDPNVFASDWNYQMRVRLTEPNDPRDAGVSMAVFDGTTTWELHLGRDGTDLLVGIRANAGVDSTTLSGLGDGYHLYEFRYDASGGTIGLFIDGVVVSGFETNGGRTDDIPAAAPLIWWGAGGSSQMGSGHYNYVRFPEPGVALLLVATAVVLGRKRRRL